MICENPSLLKILLFAIMIIDFIKIALPIGLILLASIDLGKAVVSGKEEDIKQYQSTFAKRFIYAVIVFVIPNIIGVTLGFLGEPGTALSTCANNLNIETINKLEELAKINEKIETDDNQDIDGGTSDGGDTINTSTITVATWNIGGCHKYPNVTANKLGKVIKDNNIDIIGIQEAEHNGSSTIQNVVPIANMSNYFYTNTPAGNAILSKFSLSSKSYKTLVSCAERRALQKTIINIDGKNISFYNVHISYQSECLEKQIKDVYNKIKNDSNPVVLVGDFNVKFNCSIIINNIGSNHSIVAYDTISGGHKCTDSVIVSDDIKMLSVGSVKTDGTLTDHNFVWAKLQINIK